MAPYYCNVHSTYTILMVKMLLLDYTLTTTLQHSQRDFFFFILDMHTVLTQNLGIKYTLDNNTTGIYDILLLVAVL